MSRLDRVVHARLEDVSFADQGFRPGEFDTVIAADILEHLVNPWELLVRLKPFLAPRAQIVASIPNVRNISVAALARRRVSQPSGHRERADQARADDAVGHHAAGADGAVRGAVPDPGEGGLSGKRD